MLLAGPNHVSMQQTAQSTLPTTSMSMSGSGHGTGPGYSHSGPASQSVPLQGQAAIGNYVSRANINMQSNPGTTLLGARTPRQPRGPPRSVQAVHAVPWGFSRVGAVGTDQVGIWLCGGGFPAIPGAASGKAVPRGGTCPSSGRDRAHAGWGVVWPERRSGQGAGPQCWAKGAPQAGSGVLSPGKHWVPVELSQSIIRWISEA